MSDFLFSGSANSPLFILIVNIVLIIMGLSMAFASGRAIAKTWRPYSSVPVYAVILTAAERFLHYALAGQPLLSVPFYIISFILILASSSTGYRRMRVKQMTTQYSWLFRSSGGFGWAGKP